MNNYLQADQQLHRLCQIIAKANRSFVPKEEDDSHTNLGFNADKLQIEGRWIETDSKKIQLVLRLSDVCFEWQDEHGESIQTVSTAKKHIPEIEKQLQKTIAQIGLNGSDFRKPLHFEIPEYPFSGQPVALLSRLALNEWIFWRTLANQASEFVLKKLDKEAEIRIWPHHFDTGIYVQVNEHMGIGFGLAMKDEKVNAPYFYASGYLNEGEVDYSNASALARGKWVLEEWKGAVLTIEELEFRNSEFSFEIVKEFISETMEWFLDGNQKY